MLTSLSIIILLGLIASYIATTIKLPSLIGMIIVGIIIGPHCLNILHDPLLSISADLRQIALIIIITRAGFSLNINQLKIIGKPAILLSFLPAIYEIIGFVIIRPILLGLSINEALLISSIIAAVSPAIIVPRMIKLIENKKAN